MEFAGDFETHLTIRAMGTTELTALREWADRHQLKFLHIVLERGKAPSQPMLTRRSSGVLSEQLTVARGLTDQLLAGGFEVTRVKIEAAPWNQDVPQSDDAAENHAGRYFEIHVKIVLEDETVVPRLTSLAQGRSAHLSRNAFQIRPDGRQERFVTQRSSRVGREEARRRLDQLLDELVANGFHPLETEEEFVVYDSNIDVDAGWLEA